MRYRPPIVTFALAIWLLVGIQPDKIGPLSLFGWAVENRAVLTIESNQLEEAIHLSAGYLIRQCSENGKFLYRINVSPTIRPKPRYNLLRHAGAVYALATYDQAYPQELTQNVLKRATDFLKESAIAPLPGKKDLLAVWSHPEITRSNKPLQAKLGGTGIGLVALLSVERRIPGTTPVEYLRRMGNFLLFMQKNDGSFYSKYIPEKGGRDDSWTSLYYPGEAALGLLMLYEKDPSLTWLQAAANSIAYLVRKRKGKKLVEADHWALLATAKLLPLYDRCRQPLPKQAIERHAVQICENILKGKPDNYDNSLEFGGFTEDGRTTPTAIRLEGMIAALSFLPADYSNLRKQMVVAIDEGIQFLLRSQIRSGEHAGGIPRAIHILPENHPQFKKSFNRRATEVRIDYVQHTLSAMLQYERIFF
jgi:hypothetical protein